jgi:hypothetical protein
MLRAVAALTGVALCGTLFLDWYEVAGESSSGWSAFNRTDLSLVLLTAGIVGSTAAPRMRIVILARTGAALLAVAAIANEIIRPPAGTDLATVLSGAVTALVLALLLLAATAAELLPSRILTPPSRRWNGAGTGGLANTGVPPPQSALSTALLAAGLFAWLGAMATLAIVVADRHSESSEQLAYYLLLALAAATAVAAPVLERHLRTPGALGVALLMGVAAAVLLSRIVASVGGSATETTLLFLALIPAVSAVPYLAGRRRYGLERRSPPAAVLPVVLLAAVLTFVPATMEPVPGELVTEWGYGVAGAAAIVAYLVSGVRFKPRGRRLRTTFDIAAGAVLFAIAVDISFYPGTDLGSHQAFYLGPVNHILHGHPILVDAYGQYGVLVYDVIAAWFEIAPIGHGTFSLLLGVVTGLLYVAKYAIVTLATRSRLLAAASVTVAAVVLLFGQQGFYISYPSTGVLRFGLPYLVLLAWLVGARFPRAGRFSLIAQWLVLAIASIWSAETAFHSFGVAATLTAVDVARVSRDEFGRALLRKIALLVSAPISAALIFAAATRLFGGAWPDAGPYFDYLRLYTTDEFGTLLVQPWSPGIALATAYVLSATALGALVIRARDLGANKILVGATVALSVLGALQFGYYVGRSHPNNIIHIAGPGILLGACWIALLRTYLGAMRTAVRVANACAAFLAALAFVGAADDFESKWPRTVAAAAVGVEGSIPDRLGTLWSNPPRGESKDHVRAAAELQRYLEDKGWQEPLVLLTDSEVALDTLIRIGRANAVGFGHGTQDSLLPELVQRAAEQAKQLPSGATVITPVDEAAEPSVTNDFQRGVLNQLEALGGLELVDILDGPGDPRLHRMGVFAFRKSSEPTEN